MRKYSEKETLSEALTRAISECIEEDILREFFQKHGEEVKKVTVLDFTFEKRLELADYNGEKRGEKNGLIKYILSTLSLKGEVPDKLADIIQAESNEEKLISWVTLAATVNSVEDFSKQI